MWIRRVRDPAAAPTISGRARLTAPLGVAVFGLFCLFMTTPARAGDPTLPEAGLTALGESKVVSVVDGDTLRLADGREVRLVGIQAPKLPLGRPNFPTWPLAEEAKRALERMAQGQTLKLFSGGATMDRHGRTLAQLEREDGLWIQAALIQAGMARAYSFPDNRALATELLTYEQAARAARRGIWANAFYRIRDPGELEGMVDSYQLVEGRVVTAAKPQSRLYLNFGTDWKTDFTVAIDAQALKLFKAAGLDPLTWEGRRLRVRGWVKSFNGPLIDVTHPEQIEVLEQ
jgi:endonuclease YncB( thermonuclease family)